MSAHAKVLTQVAPPDRVEALQRRMLGAKHNVRHRHHGHNHHRSHDLTQQSICPSLPAQKDGRDGRCHRRKKRKDSKRRCRSNERPGPQCHLPRVPAMVASEATDLVDASPEAYRGTSTTPESKRSCEGAASEEACRREALSVPAKKRKSRIGGGDPTAAVVGRNLTLGKNKAPTSNAKKANVGGDSQSKTPDLTDGKKRRRKDPRATQTRGESAAVPSSPSRKRYALGTTSSRASSSLTARASVERASTASSSYSPSPPGASTARRTDSPLSGLNGAPSSSRNHVVRPVGSRRVGKSFLGPAGSPDRPSSTPPASTTSSDEMARGSYPTSSITKVPETAMPPPSSSPPTPTTLAESSSRREPDEDSSESLSDSSLVRGATTSLPVATGTLKPVVSTISSEVVAEPTTIKSAEESDEDDSSETVEANPWAIRTRFPIERLAM